MNLKNISKKPQLIEVTLHDEEIQKEFGEALTFYTWDRQPMEVFTRLANVENNPTAMIEIVKSLILDEAGQPILTDDNMPPTGVLMKAIAKVTELLGK
jgi:hypothetical protein